MCASLIGSLCDNLPNREKQLTKMPLVHARNHSPSRATGPSSIKVDKPVRQIANLSPQRLPGCLPRVLARHPQKLPITWAIEHAIQKRVSSPKAHVRMVHLQERCKLQWIMFFSGQGVSKR